MSAYKYMAVVVYICAFWEADQSATTRDGMFDVKIRRISWEFMTA